MNLFDLFLACLDFLGISKVVYEPGVDITNHFLSVAVAVKEKPPTVRCKHASEVSVVDHKGRTRWCPVALVMIDLVKKRHLFEIAIRTTSNLIGLQISYDFLMFPDVSCRI